MKLQFVWWFDRAKEIYPKWRDGLRAALEVIATEHEVVWNLGEKDPEDGDFILFWGDSNCPFFNSLDKYKGKKGIILTTDPHNIENLKKLDVVYCESTPVYEAVRRQGIRAIKAFGTDTSFFKPTDEMKYLKYFYPATFSPWKRQEDIAYLGKDLCCVGTVQPDGQAQLEACEKQGVKINVGYFDVDDIRQLYDVALHVVIPAIHGSERTVLEAMSMDILPIVNKDNIRTYSYIEEFKQSGMYSPRQFVTTYYSEKQYAEKLLKGML